jgi:hypothetical protein
MLSLKSIPARSCVWERQNAATTHDRDQSGHEKPQAAALCNEGVFALPKFRPIPGVAWACRGLDRAQSPWSGRAVFAAMAFRLEIGLSSGEKTGTRGRLANQVGGMVLSR